MFVGFGNEAAYVDALLAEYQGRLPDAREFALTRRVVLLQTASGVGIDVGLGGLPLEAEMVHRSTLFEYAPGIALRTCSAEDLLVLKAVADRPQDRVDIRGIAYRQMGRLDWDAILDRITPLVELKEEPEILTAVKALRDETTA